MTSGLIFHPKAHRYRLDGHPVPGVTTLIKNGYPNAALKYWAARTVAEYVTDNPDPVEALRGMGRLPMIAALKEIPWQYRDEAAVKGTDVHALAERLQAGDEVEVPDHLAGHVESCVDFLDTWQPKSVAAERPCAHRGHQWAGTFDYIGHMPDGETWLIDWKTGSGVYDNFAFQLAAYARAEFYNDDDNNEQPMPHIDQLRDVHLRADGYDVIPIPDPRLPVTIDDLYKEFRHIAFVAGAAKRAKGDKKRPGYIGAPLDPPNNITLFDPTQGGTP